MKYINLEEGGGELLGLRMECVEMQTAFMMLDKSSIRKQTNKQSRSLQNLLNGKLVK